jgi:putative intracellular protease/amidase
MSSIYQNHKDMKKFFLFILLGVILFSCSKESPKVLLFIKHGKENINYMLTKEVGTMRQILEKSGYKVVIATGEGKIIKTDSIQLTPDVKLANVKISDYDGFIFPCMSSDTIEPGVVAFVKNVVAKNKPIAAQLGSVLILAEAGSLQGKKFAFMDQKDENAGKYPVLKGGIFSGTGIVKDGNIITSGTCSMAAKIFGLEDGTPGLTNALIDAMKIIEKGK